ncbi:CvpA family protein [Gluconacetobacter azotocaptans]|uniref:CvpA family protein n=1 Tax=Gluconacetobacter azotocaptans TaxID=142834 RepID=A0A7W4JW05_9PROT|nr:CvpA family protein [Gluconacetobacter azotocaptans]MBB2191927.1 CvpA family protein [Gluconacetobacter azotocaptans]MBM9403568.1 CvpA family protein [Gluconacetobacter azotocaptans]GBQ32756.1 colicin V production protein [Gluconacetobacter azotocaptans DSM 13594]
MNWNWADLLCGGVVVVSALFGCGRGLVREMLGLGGWIGAVALAAHWTGSLQPVAARWIANPLAADTAAFVVPFVGLLVVFTLVAQACGRRVRGSALGALDGTLGLLFGGARGYGVLVALYLAAGLIGPPASWPDEVRDAHALPLVAQGAFYLAPFLPISMQPRLAQPGQTRHDAPI